MSTPTKSHTLDVRPLIASGQEPFATIRTKVDALGPDETLEVIAPFLPAPLIEMLKAEGFSANMEHRADGPWAVLFRRVC